MNFFKEFHIHNENGSVSEIKDIGHDELTIWLVMRVEVFVNYNMYKHMCGFREGKGDNIAGLLPEGQTYNNLCNWSTMTRIAVRSRVKGSVGKLA